MGYVSDALVSGEKVLHEGRFHWIYMAEAWFVFVSFAFLALVLLITEEHFATGFSFFLAGTIFVIYRALIQWTTEVAITNRRLIYKAAG